MWQRTWRLAARQQQQQHVWQQVAIHLLHNSPTPWVYTSGAGQHLAVQQQQQQGDELVAHLNSADCHNHQHEILQPHKCDSIDHSRQQQQQWQEQPCVGSSEQCHQSAANTSMQPWPSQRPLLCHNQQQQQQQQLQEQQQQQASLWQGPWQCLSTLQQQQTRAYHPAQHRARMLTTKFLQQRSWQDLQLMTDAAGGSTRLNPIQLSALLQQMARLAPPPELLTGGDRQHLQAFVAEAADACVAKLHRFDAVGLANIILSLCHLGAQLPQQPAGKQQPQSYTAPAQRQRQLQLEQEQQDGGLLGSAAGGSGGSSSSSGSNGGSRGSSGVAAVHSQVLAAATRHIATAHGHGIAMLVSALATLQQRQQQEVEAQLMGGADTQQQHQQQHQLWQGFVTALSTRLQQMAATGQLSSSDASSICLAIGRLCAALRAQHGTAQHSAHGMTDQGHGTAPAAADGIADDQQQQQQGRGFTLHKQLRSLLASTAQQVASAPASPAGHYVHAGFAGAATAVVQDPATALLQPSRVLSALAKARTWPGWPTLYGLLQQYVSALGAAGALSTTTAGAASFGGSGGSKKRTRKQQAAMADPSGADPSAGAVDAFDDAMAACRDSLTHVVWAVGKLSQQHLEHLARQQQQQPARLQQASALQELGSFLQLWQVLGPILQASRAHLMWFGPSQLAHTAIGLGRLVHSSKRLVQAAEPQHLQEVTTAPAASGQAASMLPADASRDAAARLQGHLTSAALQRLIQQHGGRTEALLPLLSQGHRLQLALAYQQLGVQLPRAVAVVFERDAAQGYGYSIGGIGV